MHSTSMFEQLSIIHFLSSLPCSPLRLLYHHILSLALEVVVTIEQHCEQLQHVSRYFMCNTQCTVLPNVCHKIGFCFSMLYKNYISFGWMDGTAIIWEPFLRQNNSKELTLFLGIKIDFGICTHKIPTSSPCSTRFSKHKHHYTIQKCPK